MSRNLVRSEQFVARTVPGTQEKLQEIVKLRSVRLGTKLTCGQVLEMLLSEALEKENCLIVS